MKIKPLKINDMIAILFIILLIVLIIYISRSSKAVKQSNNERQTDNWKKPESDWIKQQREQKEKSEREARERDDKIKTPVDITDSLIKLKKLLDDGVLTQSEFDEQKRKMLNN